MYNLIGITNLEKNCGNIIPSIYVRVYYYIPCIEDIIWPDCLKTKKNI